MLHSTSTWLNRLEILDRFENNIVFYFKILRNNLNYQNKDIKNCKIADQYIAACCGPDCENSVWRVEDHLPGDRVGGAGDGEGAGEQARGREHPGGDNLNGKYGIISKLNSNILKKRQNNIQQITTLLVL